MKRLADLVWFLLHSWSYLGCDRGTGRWDARRMYFQKIVPTSITYLRLRSADR